MPVFARSFDVDALSRWKDGKTGTAIHALFDGWALPGQPSTPDAPLRLGVRNGYLNFYASGQSVAKLSIVLGRPQLSVHEAYVTGRKRGDERADVPAGQRYETFGAAWLADPANAWHVAGWIGTAQSYASAEKCFADELIAANAGVIDLEMALPASDTPGSDRVSPRMDLVVVETLEDGPPAIAFWEAKCANNSELRSSKPFELHDDGSHSGPSVIHQIGKYVRWMDEARSAEVRSAFPVAAARLLDLARLVHGENAEELECARIWQELIAVEPKVIVQPGIVIGNYWPKGFREPVASERMAQHVRRFASTHRGELLRHGMVIQEVGLDDERALPPISRIVLSA